MRILQVIPYFHPKRGGDVNVCYNISKQLAKRSHEVMIITTDFEFDKEFAESIEKEGVEVITFHCVANFGLFLYSPNMKKWLKQNIRNYDVIHLHTYRAYQNNVIWHYAKKNKVPYVIQAHGSLLTFFVKPRLKKLYDLVWGYRILKDAVKVIAITKTEAEQYKKMGVDEDKIEIVPNGIDPSQYKNLPKRGRFRKKYGIKDEEKIILYVGRLNESKGIDLLIEAFASLTDEFPNIKLVLIGPDNGYQLKLEKMAIDLKIMDKVIFTGFISQTDKIAAFVDADVFVTPSFSGFPVTFLEGCACGVPIITTNRGDKLDWVHNKVGFVVEYDKDQLRNAIIKVLGDEGLRKTFGEEGRRLVMEEFGWNEIVRKVERLYESLMGVRHL